MTTSRFASLRSSSSWRAVAFAAVLGTSLLAACGSDETVASDGPGILFHGETAALPGFSYDTGLIPAASPAQVAIKLAAGGNILVDAQGVSSGGALSGKAGTGKLSLDVKLKLEGRLKVVTPIKTYDGEIPGLANIDVPIVGQQTFDPFLLDDGASAEVGADIPETKLPDIPLGSAPGTLKLTIVAGSKLTAKLGGECMSVASGAASYKASATLGGKLVVKGEIQLELPAPFNKTIELAEFSVPIPETLRPIPFEPVTVAGINDADTGAKCTAKPGGGGGGEDGGGLPPGSGSCLDKDCTGCCRDDVCLPGSSTSACGARGGACETCSGTAECISGACKAPCGPENCDGCCNAGVCVNGSNPASCGIGGNTCKSCSASETCNSGACVSLSCRAACSTGCCTGTSCQLGTTDTACGGSGNACVACGKGSKCTNHACAPDPNALFDVVAVSATVPTLNKSAGAWDAFGGLPDPYAVLKTPSGATGQTTFKSDTASPTWNETVLTNVKGSDLKTFTVTLNDDDVSFDDLIGPCTVTVPASALSGATTTSACPATATGVAYQFRYRLVAK